MATRQRSTSTTSRPRRKTTPAARSTPSAPLIAPHVLRSLVGLVLLVLGAVTVVALVIPGSGVLGRLVDEWLRPAFGQGAWLLAILLAVAGVVVERGSSVANGWSVAAVGALITFIAGLALLHLVAGGGHSPAALRNGGGAFGDGVGGGMAGLLGTPAALIVLLGLIAAGLILLFNTTLRQLLSPAVSGGKIIASAVSTPARSIADSAANKMTPAEPETKERKPVVVPVARSVMPEPMSSPLPISPQHLFAWRKAARRGQLALPADEAAVFVPVMMAAQKPVATTPSITIETAGIVVRAECGVDVGWLAAVLRVVKGLS